MVAPAENDSATLLIVDDDAAARDRLREIFETAHYRVVTATEASSALRVLKGVRCDLVALDLEMPGVDGLALCKLLRAQPTTSKLPIIALSESDDEARKVQAFTAGADDYITKPSTPGELLSRVSLHVRTSQREWALIGSNRELRFLSDIGRGLLRALEPEQLVRRVAGATYEAIDVSLCAAYVTVARDKHALCVFDREGSADDPSLLDSTRLQHWLRSSESANSTLITEKESFLLRDDVHTAEYVSPVRFAGRSKRPRNRHHSRHTSVRCTRPHATSQSVSRAKSRNRLRTQKRSGDSYKQLSIVCRCRFTRSIARIAWWRGIATAS